MEAAEPIKTEHIEAWRKPGALSRTEREEEEDLRIADRLALYAVAGAGYSSESFADIFDAFFGDGVFDARRGRGGRVLQHGPDASVEVQIAFDLVSTRQRFQRRQHLAGHRQLQHRQNGPKNNSGERRLRCGSRKDVVKIDDPRCRTPDCWYACVRQCASTPWLSGVRRSYLPETGSLSSRMLAFQRAMRSRFCRP